MILGPTKLDICCLIIHDILLWYFISHISHNEQCLWNIPLMFSYSSDDILIIFYNWSCQHHSQLEYMNMCLFINTFISMHMCFVVTLCFWHTSHTINSSSPGENGHHFAYDIFKGISVNKKFCILIKISLKLVPKGPIDNNTALV